CRRRRRGWTRRTRSGRRGCGTARAARSPACRQPRWPTTPSTTVARTVLSAGSISSPKIRRTTARGCRTSRYSANAVFYSAIYALVMLDPRRLQMLRAVAEHGTVSAAAEALFLTQPAVSRQLAKLEREAGTRLLDRTPR